MPPGAGKTTRMAAIVLAAGGSVRMRPAHKLLLPIGGEALIRRAVRSAREAELFPIIVVVGYRGNEAAAAVADLGVICLPNPEWETGIASSIRAGIAALPDDCPGTVILLADMPRVDASHLRRLSNAFASNEEAGILIPTYRGRRGNPLIWSRRHFAALAALSGDRGGSALLVQLGPFVREVPMEDDGVLVDLDTPDEFRREVLRALSRGKGSDPKGRCPERELLLSPSNGKR